MDNNFKITVTPTATMTMTECIPNWQYVGNRGFSIDMAGGTSLYVDNGTPYITYTDVGYWGATVMKYTGNGSTGWELVGSKEFSAGQAYNTSLYIDNGVPYVAYSDNANGSRATVMEYTKKGSTGWESLGSAGFSAGGVMYTSLSINNGVQYVAYQDQSNNNKATVMKYTGNGSSGWENVGSTTGFSAGEADYTSLYIDNGVPFVAYKDIFNSYGATVMKYTGNGSSGWENVGSAGFSAGEASFTSLFIDNGVAYVAYEDIFNNGKATVMKHTGNGSSEWEPIGNAGFSAGGAGYISLYIGNGIPYVAFEDTVKGGTVMEDTGKGSTGWEIVGSAGFSPSGVEYTSLYISNGVPFVAYGDSPDYNYAASVMKYDCIGGSGNGMNMASVSKFTPTPTPTVENKFDTSTVYNYPNPSTGKTTIRFALPEPQEVKILIYNINGKQVWAKTLSETDTVRGINTIIWDGKNDVGVNVANGIYIYRVAIKDKTIIKKIAIIH
jgi:hypothetical protein